MEKKGKKWGKGKNRDRIGIEWVVYRERRRTCESRNESAWLATRWEKLFLSPGTTCYNDAQVWGGGVLSKNEPCSFARLLLLQSQWITPLRQRTCNTANEHLQTVLEIPLKLLRVGGIKESGLNRAFTVMVAI